MLLSERVREIGADQSDVEEATVRLARQALRQEIARSARPERARRSRRAWTGIGVGGFVAGAAVTAIVVGAVVSPVETPTASAAEVLNAAAEAASDPVLDAGQYLAVSATFEYVQHWDLETQRPAADRADADGSFLVDQPIVRYKPADADNAEWIVDRQQDAVVQTWGEPAAAEQWWELIGQSLADVAGVRRYPGGVSHAERDGEQGEAYFIDGRDFYLGMPDEPAGIIEWWSARYADERDEGGYAHFFIETVTDVGTFNLAPAEIRSAMLGAFASVEGMEVVRSDGDRAVMRFDRGTESRPSVLEFVLDTEHGYILSVTDWGQAVPGADDSGAPSWQSRTESSVTVVDAAP